MLKYFYNDYVPPKIQKAIEEAKKFVCTTKDRIVNDATDIGNEILLNLIVAPIKAKDFANGICASVGDNSLGGYHAYEVQNPATEVPTEVLRQMKKDGLISNAQYKKWVNNK